jgi:LmbE family N-acetylglucosaminyl deacetylase
LSTLLAVSPHLDDAVFSAGAFLARQAQVGIRVVIATCFTKSVPSPTGFALACQLDKGLGPEIDYMALRRAEDRGACARIGAEPVHLPFPEAPHRGYDSAAALFGPALPNDDVGTALLPTLADLVDRVRPDLLLLPACIGDHVDHWAVRTAGERLGRPIRYWADLPYAARQLDAVPDDGQASGCADAYEAKLEAARAYSSQLGFQFRDGAMAELLAIDGAELFWNVPPANRPSAIAASVASL